MAIQNIKIRYTQQKNYLATFYTYFYLKLEAAHWTTWTSWDACRDDRLSSYGITNTDTSYLTTHQGGNCYNKKTRHCQNQVSSALKYARNGGANTCYHNYVSNSDGINDHTTRTCPGLPSSPSNKLFPTCSL